MFSMRSYRLIRGSDKCLPPVPDRCQMQTDPRPLRALSDTTACRRIPLYTLAHLYMLTAHLRALKLVALVVWTTILQSTRTILH